MTVLVQFALHFQTSLGRHSGDQVYMLRTNFSAEQIDTAGTVRAYKSLAQMERAFRCLKTVDLDLRPVFHWTAPRVRAHVLLCTLAYWD